jgi:hypothetical protein
MIQAVELLPGKHKAEFNLQYCKTKQSSTCTKIQTKINKNNSLIEKAKITFYVIFIQPPQKSTLI